MDAIVVSARVTVPPAAVETQFARSGGPGGQNVNKLATKVQLRVDLSAVIGWTDEERALARGFLASRLDAEGRLMITSQLTRDQARNVEDARGKTAALLRAAIVRPRTRRLRKPSRAAKERRREEKKRHAQRVRERRVEWGNG